MIFYVLKYYEISRITSSDNYDHTYMMNIEHEIAVPLYTALTGFNKVPHNRMYTRNWNGFNIRNNYYNDYRYTMTDAVVMLLYCDRVDHYKAMYDEAVAAGLPSIIVANKDVIRLRYKKKVKSFNFTEQKYIIETVPDMISDILSCQNEFDAALKESQIKLI